MSGNPGWSDNGPHSSVTAWSEVEQYVTSELDLAQRYDNRQPLDDSGVFTLHMLAASIYARGWADGERAQGERDRGQRQRDRTTGAPA